MRRPGRRARLTQLGAEIATPGQMTAKGFAAFIQTEFGNAKAAVIPMNVGIQ